MKKLLIFLFYLVPAIFFTYPQILYFQDRLPGVGAMDELDYIWNIDTFWYQIFQLKNPFFTDRIHFPFGANLLFHDYSPFTNLLGLFFIGNYLFYLNFLILLSLMLSGVAMFMLLKYKIKNIPASLLGGLIYAFNPVTVSFLQTQHYYYILAAAVFPLALLSLFKLLDHHSRTNLIVFGLLFWIIFFTNYYSAIFIILAFLVITAFYRKKMVSLLNKKFIKENLYLILIFLMPLIFFAVAMKTSSESFAYQSENFYPGICNSNIVGFLIPGENSIFLKSVEENMQQFFNVSRNGDTPSIFLGWGIFLAAILACIKLKKDKFTRSFMVIAILAILLSSGTVVRFGEYELASGQWTLFYWFSKLPFLSLLDCPIRINIITHLAIAILAALFINSFSNLKKYYLIIVFSLIIFFIEFGFNNLPFIEVAIPNIYKLIPTTKTATILELPSGLTESKGAFGYDWSIHGLLNQQMYWQTFHYQRRIGGFTSRVSQDKYAFFKKEVILADLFEMTSLNGEWSNKKYTPEEISQFIQKFDLEYIILSPNSRQSIFQTVVEDIFASNIKEKIYSDGFFLYTLKR